MQRTCRYVRRFNCIVNNDKRQPYHGLTGWIVWSITLLGNGELRSLHANDWMSCWLRAAEVSANWIRQWYCWLPICNKEPARRQPHSVLLNKFFELYERHLAAILIQYSQWQHVVLSNLIIAHDSSTYCTRFHHCYTARVISVVFFFLPRSESTKKSEKNYCAIVQIISLICDNCWRPQIHLSRSCIWLWL